LPPLEPLDLPLDHVHPPQLGAVPQPTWSGAIVAPRRAGAEFPRSIDGIYRATPHFPETAFADRAFALCLCPAIQTKSAVSLTASLKDGKRV
jgi:hypothetical protein